MSHDPYVDHYELNIATVVRVSDDLIRLEHWAKVVFPTTSFETARAQAIVLTQDMPEDRFEFELHAVYKSYSRPLDSWRNGLC